jgi:hypothetical protein
MFRQALRVIPSYLSGQYNSTFLQIIQSIVNNSCAPMADDVFHVTTKAAPDSRRVPG